MPTSPYSLCTCPKPNGILHNRETPPTDAPANAAPEPPAEPPAAVHAVEPAVEPVETTPNYVHSVVAVDADVVAVALAAVLVETVDGFVADNIVLLLLVHLRRL